MNVKTILWLEFLGTANDISACGAQNLMNLKEKVPIHKNRAYSPSKIHKMILRNRLFGMEVA